MRVDFYTNNFNSFYSKNEQPPTFQGRASLKLLEKIKTTKELKYIKATFDDMVRAYSELGYDVLTKRGSHAVVVISDKIRLSLVIPHGSKKKGYVTVSEVKKLKYVALGDVEKAKLME